ncbi:MAG: Ni/Fe hydrogenase [Hydrogenophilales bacterium 28-61-23]|nr:MAG: Ni/Fe hydrogenase [Hydrogenophilales bacterium 28-61-23]
MSEPLPILVIGIGNPSRGDDALGPLLIERLEALQLADTLPDVELLTDFQLQVEFALDLQGRQQVIFIDASLNAATPFQFSPIAAVEDSSYSSHALSPSAVLHAYRKLFGEPPPAFVLAIRGEAFELGEGLSEAATNNLEAALGWLRKRLMETVAD